jgi:hypothetical protein
MILFGLSIRKKGLMWLLANICCIIIFTLAYLAADLLTHNFDYIKQNFGESSEKDFMDYLYFSLITQTTVGLDIDGFGYSNFINPQFKSNKLTRLVNILQLVSVLVMVATSV